MQDLVLDLLPATDGQCVDLFCGLGTFALPLAQNANVWAVDGDASAIRALSAAVNQNGLASRVSATIRDLFREPATAEELNGARMVVFDPPRAGAKAQATEIAASTVPVVVAVSCNPATLARDLKTLVEGGYQIEKVQPIDQFLWSPHIETVAILTRD